MPNILILTGATGSGKTTIANLLPGYTKVTTCTTRSRREDESVEDYYFIDRECFEHCIQEGSFLEWIEYNGNLYGTLKSEISGKYRAGQNLVIVADLDGARNMSVLLEKEGYARPAIVCLIRDFEASLKDRKERADLLREEQAKAQGYEIKVYNRTIPETLRDVLREAETKRED